VLLTGAAYGASHLGITVFTSLITLIFTFKVFKKSIGRFNSLTFFFLLFYVLYTYSPVLTILFDIDNRRIFTESTPEIACSYIFSSTLGLFSLSIPYMFVIKIKDFNGIEVVNRKKQFSLYAIFFIVVATLGELTNLFRAGGIELLASGKAIYQAATSDLFITFPTILFLQIGFFFLGLRLFITYGKNLKRIPKNILFLLIIIISTPVIVIYLSMGFRSPLLAIAIAFLMGISYFLVLKTIDRKIVFFVFVGYSLLAILFGVRGHLRLLFTTGDWGRFHQYIIKEKTFLYYYNPANNEFGAPFKNYTKFYKDKDKTPFLYGSSYFQGFYIIIPRKLLPFDKPTPISYKFRDKYFKEYTASRIAGSGFSSIMEAEWNFGIIGVSFVYFLTGCFFWLLEYLRNRYKFLFVFPLFYAMIVPMAQYYHRSSSGYMVSTTIFLCIFLLFLYLCKKLFVEMSNKN